MIRYSSYVRSNHPKTAKEAHPPGTLEAQYHELLKLRERVKQAENATTVIQKPQS